MQYYANVTWGHRGLFVASVIPEWDQISDLMHQTREVMIPWFTNKDLQPEIGYVVVFSI